MKYDTILFDADGTLLDFLRAEREAVAEAFSMLNISVTDEMLDEYSKINDSMWAMLSRGEIDKAVLKYRRFEIFFDKFGITADAREMARAYLGTLGKYCYLLDGAKELIEALHGKARLYIVTNGIKPTQESRLANSGLLPYFDGLFISECTGYEKPQVEFFEYVAAHIPHFDKSRTVIVGDSLISDIQGGINFGIDTCWYAPDGRSAPTDLAPFITYTVRSFKETYDILTKGE